MGINIKADLENYMPEEVNVIISSKDFFNKIEYALKADIFKLLTEIQKKKEPHKPTLYQALEKIKAHPISKFNEIVIGVAHKGKNNDAVVIAARAEGPVEEYIKKFLEEEKKKGKSYELPTESYKGNKVIVNLSPKDGKLEKKYTLIKGQVVLHSNSKDLLAEYFDNYESKQTPLVLPQAYKNLEDSLIKAYINVKKIEKKEIKKEHPFFIRKYIKKLYKMALDTDGIIASVTLQKGVKVEIIRLKKDGTPYLIPETFGQNFINSKTMAFLSLPIPFDIVWNVLKIQGQKKAAKKWRMFESKLDEFFGWASFEEEILPLLGPNANVILDTPNITSEKPFYPPNLTLTIKTKNIVDVITPLNKLWGLLTKHKPNIHKLVEKTQSETKLGKCINLKFKVQPLKDLVKPAIICNPAWIVLTSNLSAVRNLLNSSQQTGNQNIYLYVRPKLLTDWFKMNIPFFKKEAQKKGKPFEKEKIKLLMKVVQKFEYIELKSKKQGNQESLSLSLFWD